jgi:hypothetical protein
VSDPTPYRPAQFYAPAGASTDAMLQELAEQVALIRFDLIAVRDLLLPMLDAPTRERLRGARWGHWRRALSGLEVGNGD